MEADGREPVWPPHASGSSNQQQPMQHDGVSSSEGDIQVEMSFTYRIVSNNRPWAVTFQEEWAFIRDRFPVHVLPYKRCFKGPVWLYISFKTTKNANFITR